MIGLNSTEEIDSEGAAGGQFHHLRIILDKADRWHPIENYINARTGANFTHGYCPECAEKVIRELQPLGTVCKKCGCNLDVTRYVLEGRHFRRYSCPECGYSQEYVRERLEK